MKSKTLLLLGFLLFAGTFTAMAQEKIKEKSKVDTTLLKPQKVVTCLLYTSDAADE